jgi:hypothetical protein
MNAYLWKTRVNFKEEVEHSLPHRNTTSNQKRQSQTSCCSFKRKAKQFWGHPAVLNHKKWLVVPRKCAKVVLSKEQREILNELARRLGTSESETLRMALRGYAKELSLMKESIHRGIIQV